MCFDSVKVPVKLYGRVVGSATVTTTGDIHLAELDQSAVKMLFGDIEANHFSIAITPNHPYVPQNGN